MRRDLFHSACREALERDGWLVTVDPIDLTIGAVELFADLGADRMFAAERENEKIAVEIKSFVGRES